MNQLWGSLTKLTSRWREDWQSATVVNSTLVVDPTIRLPSFDLHRRRWSLLNRFRTGQGHCNACHKKWGFTDNELCDCGETQTMSHIVNFWRRSTALTWSRWGCRRLADNIWLLAHDNNNNWLSCLLVGIRKAIHPQKFVCKFVLFMRLTVGIHNKIEPTTSTDYSWLNCSKHLPACSYANCALCLILSHSKMSSNCLIFCIKRSLPSVLRHRWLGNRKGIQPVKKLGVGLSMVTIWLELCTL